MGRPSTVSRSEEHTSELQSRLVISYAVFCLKKKKRALDPEHSDPRTNHRDEADVVDRAPGDDGECGGLDVDRGHVVLLLTIRPPPTSTQQGTLFPYTTLFRSIESTSLTNLTLPAGLTALQQLDLVGNPA